MALDTDLGSDVDDALALAVLLGSPELDLLGASTVYGDVRMRARLLAGFAALAGRDVPAHPGRSQPLSGRPVWVSGEEGQHFAGLDHLVTAPPSDRDGVDWLLEQARAAEGELEIVAVGPLTNLAHAVRSDPGFVTSVRRVWLMGGSFEEPATGRPEHNFASDAVAADEVIRSGLRLTVTGLEITRQVRLDGAAVAELGTAGPLGAQLERETRAWMAYWNEPHDVPHDAVTVIAMLRPDLFTERPIRVCVQPGGEDAGAVRHDRTGTVVNVVTAVDVPAVTREILDRIRVASRGEPCAT